MHILFPKFISNKSINLYFIILVVICILFSQYAMKWYWFLFGAVEVVCFFYYSNYLTKSWSLISPNVFKKKLFKYAFLIRLFAVIFLYFFFDAMTGQPFMFAAADSVAYHKEGIWLSECIRSGDISPYISYIVSKGGVSDIGYPVWLGINYSIFGPNIIVIRIIKAILSAYSCVLIYKITYRNFSDDVARMSSIFCMLMPNLIVYSGMHMKETEMIFLILLYIERTDTFLREKCFNIIKIIPPLLLAGSLFFFRTVLGVTAFISLFVSLVLTNKEVIKQSVKIKTLLLTIIIAITFGGTTIYNEINQYWQNREINQETRLKEREMRGNQIVKYAGAAVFAPMIFTLPFPTLVETEGQEFFRMIHGGNYIKNVMSFFTIMAIFILIFNKNWKNHVFIGSFLILYLIILTLSAFAHAERFHLPCVPLEMIFAAVGVSLCNRKNAFYFNYWMIIIFVANIVWAWLKLKGRGVL